MVRFERDGNELKAANFKNLEGDFENDDDFLSFLEVYSQYDGAIVFKLSNTKSSNFIVNDDNDAKYLVGFKNFVNNNIG